MGMDEIVGWDRKQFFQRKKSEENGKEGDAKGDKRKAERSDKKNIRKKW